MHRSGSEYDVTIQFRNNKYTWEVRNPAYDLWNRQSVPYSTKYEAETAEAVIELLKPCRRKQYLANGNFYKED